MLWAATESCTECGNARPSGDIMCEACRVRRGAKTRAARRAELATEQAATREAAREAARRREAARAAAATTPEQRRQRNREQAARRYAERRAKGLCGTCGERPAIASRCDPCRVKYNPSKRPKLKHQPRGAGEIVRRWGPGGPVYIYRETF